MRNDTPVPLLLFPTVKFNDMKKVDRLVKEGGRLQQTDRSLKVRYKGKWIKHPKAKTDVESKESQAMTKR